MDVGSVTARLQAVFDDKGFARFDAAMHGARSQSEKALRAELGANFSEAGFRRYNEQLDKAERRTKDRAAFKAQLGADFHPAAFNQYERALSRSSSQHVSFAKSVETTNSRVTRSFARAGPAVASALTGMTFGLGAVATGSLNLAVGFEKAMLLLHTQAGYAEKDVKRLSEAVLALSPKAGFSPDDLANSLFHIASAGVPAAKAMDVLQAAVKGARVGSADLETTANGLVGILRTAPKDIKGAGDAMGVLSAIVGQGNLRLRDLTAALGTGILPAAKSFGLGLRDIGAALDVMTARHIPAVAGATRLRQTLSMMAAPTSAATKALATIGMSVSQLGTDLHKPNGLVVALTDLKKRLDASGLSAVEQSRVISKAFGGGRTSAGILLLLQNIGDLRKRTEALGSQTGTKKLDDAFRKTQRDSSANIERLKASFQVFGIAIGKAIEPALPTLSKIALAIGVFIKQMRDGKGSAGDFAKGVKTAFDVISTVIGVWIDFVKETIKVAKIQFGIGKKAVELLVDAFGDLEKAVKALGGLFDTIWHGIEHVVGKAISDMLGALSTFLRVIADIANAKLPFVGKVFGNTGTKIDQTADKVDSFRKKMASMGTDSVAANKKMAIAYAGGTTAVGKAMESNRLTVSAGLAKVNKLMTDAFNKLGVKLVDVGIKALPFTTKARGGWIGDPGEVGPDSVHALLAPGEAVLNRHQQRYVNQALEMVYGMDLPTLFSKVDRPHGMEKGGLVQKFAAGGKVVTASAFGGRNDPGAYMHQTASGKLMDDHLVGYAELSNPPGSLNFSAMGHLPMGTVVPVTFGGKTIRIPKVDRGAGGPGLHGHIRAIDLTQPAANELPGFPGLADVILGNPAGISLGGTGVQAALIPAIKVLANGLIPKYGEAVINKYRTAANKKISAANAQSAAAMGGGAAGVPVFPVSAGPVPPKVQEAKKLASWVASQHPPYSTANWDPHAGLDCSGFVSYVLGGVGIEPHGRQVGGYWFPPWGEAGPGKWITVATKGTPSGPTGHVMMEIDGTYFESGGSDGGPHIDSGWSSAFDRYRHPTGFATGGVVRPGGPGNPGVGRRGYQLTRLELERWKRGKRRGEKGGKRPSFAVSSGRFARGRNAWVHPSRLWERSRRGGIGSTMVGSPASLGAAS